MSHETSFEDDLQFLRSVGCHVLAEDLLRVSRAPSSLDLMPVIAEIAKLSTMTYTGNRQRMLAQRLVRTLPTGQRQPVRSACERILEQAARA